MSISGLPSVFHVDGVGDAHSVTSYLIPDGQIPQHPRACSECPYDTYEPPSDLLFQGFDDLSEADPAEESFFPPGPPLVGNAPLVMALSRLLTGVTAVRVGFSQWNQQPAPCGEWFTRPPHLAALHVGAVCARAFGPDEKEFSRCQSCGRMRIPWYSIRHVIGQVTLDPQAWPGTDLFLIEGGLQEVGVFITDVGIKKMRERGFQNLELTPVQWNVSEN